MTAHLVERDRERGLLRTLIGRAVDGGSACAVLEGPAGVGRSAVLAATVGLAVEAGFAAAGTRRLAGPAGRGAAVLTTLRSDAGPCVALVDDLDFAEPAAVTWLCDGLDRPAGAPLLLVTEVRGEAGSGTVEPALPRLFASPVALHLIPLRGLGVDGVRAMLRAGGAGEVGADLAAAAARVSAGLPGVVAAALRRCAGRPVTADEFTAAGRAARRDRAADLLDAAPERLSDLLRMLAAWDGPAPRDLVRRLAGGPVLSGSPADGPSIRDVVDGLHRTGLLSVEAGPVGPLGMEAGGGPGTVGPLDPAAADLVLAGLDRTERDELRRRAVQMARELRVDVTVLGRLLLRTDVIGARWALDALVAAAARARRDFADALAADLLLRALREPATAARRAGILIDLGTAEARRSPLAAARRYEAVLRDADPDLAGHRIAAADLLVCTDGGAAVRAVAGTYHRTDIGEAERGCLLGLYRLAADGRHVPHDLALPVMPPVPDPPSGGAQCGAAAWARAVRADGLTATRILARTALLAGIGDRLYAPRLAAARALVLADDPDAVTHLDALVVEARMRDVPTNVTAALTTRADLALRHGRYDAAEADLDAAERTLAPSSWRIPVLVRLLAVRTLVAVETGRLDRAAEVAATPVPDAAVTTVAWTDLLYARGVLAVGTGRYREAVALLRECGRRLCADGWVNPAVAGWRSWAAVAHHALGETDAAGELTADEVAVARTWGAPSALGVAYLRAGRLAGGDRAVSLLRGAVDVLRTAPARQRREEALLALVPAALDAGDPATAAAALDEADRLAVDAGSGFAELVAQLRSRMADGDGPPGRRLSAAQRRVADLAASGFTNAAIARVLSITKRAVELHLTNAYRNLGIRGRRDLPAALRHRGGTR